MVARGYLHPLLGVEFGEWTWCFHCERVYPTARWAAQAWLCPACRAGSIEAHNWSPETWPRRMHPEYPPEPVEGERYPRRRHESAH